MSRLELVIILGHCCIVRVTVFLGFGAIVREYVGPLRFLFISFFFWAY